MRISSIGKIRTNINNTAKVSIPVKNVVSKPVETAMGMTALSGIYLAFKAVQERKEKEQSLLKLGLEQKLINEVLKKPVFNKDSINILSETSKLDDKAFFSTIINNVDNVKELKKEDNVYSLSIKSNDKEISSKLILKDDMTITESIIKINDNITKIQRKNNDKILEEKTVKKQNDKTVLNQIVKTHKINNTVETTIFDNENKKQREHYSKIKYSKDGLIIEEITGNNSFNGNNVKSSLVSINYKNGTVIKATKNGNKFDTYFDNYMFNTLNSLTKEGKSGKNILEMSEVPNVYNSKIIDKFGNEKIESFGRKNADGSVTVEKNLESLDGTKTLYKYNVSADEKNISMSYEIVSKNGKSLATVNRTYNRINDNLAFSSLNDHKYKIETTEDAYTVTDEKSGEKTVIKKDETLFYDEDSKRNHDVLDKLSGDMLLDMHNRQYKYHFNTSDGGCTYANDRIIYSPDNVYLFAHEQGHTKDLIGIIDSDYNAKLGKTQDSQHRLMNNPKFRKPYEEERQAFINEFSDFEQSFISYFIDRIDHYRGYDGGAIEMIANANAMTSTGLPYSNDNIAFHYLQKYFPRTIAAAQDILNNK